MLSSGLFTGPWLSSCNCSRADEERTNEVLTERPVPSIDDLPAAERDAADGLLPGVAQLTSWHRLPRDDQEGLVLEPIAASGALPDWRCPVAGAAGEGDARQVPSESTCEARAHASHASPPPVPADESQGSAVVDESSVTQLRVVWDAENVPIGREAQPGSFSATLLLDGLISSAGALPGGWQSVEEFRSRRGTAKFEIVLHQNEGNPWHFGRPEREALIDAGATIIDPGMKQGAVDTKVKELLSQIAWHEDPIRTAVMLIGGDRDFAPEARLLRDRNFHHLVLFHMGNARGSVQELWKLQLKDWTQRRADAGLRELPAEKQAPMAMLPPAMVPPSAPMAQVCWDFKRGVCRRGTRCRWAHVNENGEIVPKMDVPTVKAGAPAAVLLTQSNGIAGRPETFHGLKPPNGNVLSGSSKPCLQRALKAAKCLYRSAVTLLAISAVAGSLWLAFKFRDAQTFYSLLQNGTCRLTSPASSPVLPRYVISLPFTNWSQSVQAHDLPWSSTPSRSCQVSVELLTACRNSSCWNQLGVEFQHADGTATLTFAYPRQLSRAAPLPQCAALASKRFQEGTFTCSYAPENAGAWGVYAASTEQLSSIALLLTQASQAGFPVLAWVLDVVLLAICVLLYCVSALVSLLCGLLSPCKFWPCCRDDPTSVPVRTSEKGKGKGWKGYGKGMKKGGALPGTSFPHDSTSQGGRMAQVCACLHRAFAFLLFLVVAMGAAELLSAYTSTVEMYDHLEETQCFLAGDEAWAAGPTLRQLKVWNHSWVMPVWNFSLTLMPAVACWVQLEMRGDCSAGLCRTRPPPEFRSANGMTRLTFDFPRKFWDPAYHQKSCTALASRFGAESGGFPCSYVKRNAGSWGVIAVRKADLSNLPLLDLTLASQVGSPFLLWAFALCLLSVYSAVFCVASSIMRCMRCLRYCSGQTKLATARELLCEDLSENYTPLAGGPEMIP